MAEGHRQESGAAAKRLYEPPHLTVYGTVYELTAAIGEWPFDSVLRS
jgi:hypothetical protein